MKEITQIIARYDELKSTGVPLALATVVHVEDSSYRRSGARMLITADGRWTGGISGGCLEGDTLRRAQHVIRKQSVDVVRYDTRSGDESQIGVGLGCHGVIDVLITYIDIADQHNPIEQLRQTLEKREATILITDIRGSRPGKVLSPDTGQDIEYVDRVLLWQVTEQRKSYTVMDVEKQQTQYFIEYIPPAIRIVICGKNYDTVPLANIAKSIGWQVVVVAPPMKVSRMLYDLADQVYASLSQVVYDDYTVGLLMSHDYDTDLKHLRVMNQDSWSYIGILGPKVRAERMIDALSQLGVIIECDYIYAPMGLDTGATSPEEISISIIAEIRSHYAQRNGGHLRDRVGKIND